MELKVWVDGVVRVVCGLSEETSCQDVVVTLAQAIGQTGRYVLVQRLRDNERQLLANERLLETISKLGQHAGDIQFFLCRIGPNNVERPVLVKEAPGLKQPDSEYHKPKEPKKSLTFNLGPSSTPKKKLKNLKKSHGHSLEQKVLLPPPSSSSNISKDDLFQEVIQQQARLQALEVQLDVLEQELLIWEPKAAPESQPLDIKLELKLEKKLKDEMDHELAINQQLRELHHMVDSYDSRLRDLTAQSGELEQKIQQESIRHQSLPMQSKLDESLGSAKVELHKQQMHGVELDTSVTEIEKALGKTEDLVQTKTQEMDELNKELRHCNLQQFILQTGTHVHPDLHEHPGHPEHMESAHCLPDRCGNGSSLPSRCTAKQLMGHPRNLLNPLISSLHPDGIYV